MMETPAIRKSRQRGAVNRSHMGVTAGVLAVVIVAVFLLYPRPVTQPDAVPALPPAAPVTGAERGDAARDIIARMQDATEPAAPERETGSATEPGASAPVTAAPEEQAANAPKPRPEIAAEAVDRFEEAYRQARDFRDQGKLADAQLLYFFAARGGHAQAAFDLAASYDPLHFSPQASLMDKPDPFQAAKWYRQAGAQGIGTAAGRLEALHAWAEDAAEAGDAEAERLLLTWESLE